MTPGEFLEFARKQAGDSSLSFVTPSPEVIRDAVAQSAFRGSTIEQVSTVLAPIIGKLGLARAQRGELVDALALDANYIRRSDAELLWKGPQC